MHSLDRNVAGLTCRDVLARLSDVLDKAIEEPELLQVQHHLAGCDVCERFGGRVAELVATLRTMQTDEAPEGVLDRLRARLTRDTR